MTHALVTDAQHEVAALELDLADAGPVYNKKEKKNKNMSNITSSRSQQTKSTEKLILIVSVRFFR
jgi:hypothetical protein